MPASVHSGNSKAVYLAMQNGDGAAMSAATCLPAAAWSMATVQQPAKLGLIEGLSEMASNLRDYRTYISEAPVEACRDYQRFMEREVKPMVARLTRAVTRLRWSLDDNPEPARWRDPIYFAVVVDPWVAGMQKRLFALADDIQNSKSESSFELPKVAGAVGEVVNEMGRVQGVCRRFDRNRTLASEAMLSAIVLA